MFKNKKANCCNFSRTTIIAIVVAVAIIVLAASLSAVKIKNQLEAEKLSPYYQAVFLSNGQVYFGKASNRTGQFLTLRDIYYLQVNRDLQSPKEEGEIRASQSDLTLIKLGNELHGPHDEMLINRDHILFIEDLKDESKVVQAIYNHKR